MDRALKSEISALFPDFPCPGKDQLIVHECEECFGVQHDFAAIRWKEIEPARLEANYDKLPLFSPLAFHYYVPAFLSYAIENPRSDVCQFVIFALTQPTGATNWWLERWRLFSQEERVLIQRCLQAIESDRDHDWHEEGEIKVAIGQWWESKPSKPA